MKINILVYIVALCFLTVWPVCGNCIEIPVPTPFSDNLNIVVSAKSRNIYHYDGSITLYEPTWVMEVKDNKFYFNRAEFPYLSADDFAAKVIHILSRESGLVCKRK